MKKLKYFFLTLVLLLFIFNIDIVITATKESSILFFEKIFISVFPFIILCDILIYFDYHIFLKDTVGKLISKIFNIDPNVSIIFILSILTSHPANALYIKNMLDNDEIDLKSANRILAYTYFPSLAFVIGTIGINMFNSFNIGIIIYLSCLFFNFCIGIFLRGEKISYSSKSIDIKNNKNLFDTIKNSILKAINTSIIILGNIIIFNVIIKILNIYCNDNISVLFSVFLELTNGMIGINNLNIEPNLKILLTIFSLNFSGLSIIFQSMSILSGYNINIKKILIIKLIFSLVLLLISMFIVNLSSVLCLL